MPVVKILLVENENVAGVDLRAMLKDAGYEITAVARNHKEALATIRTNPPDLVLIDLLLDDPNAEGVTLAQSIQQEMRLPVLYITRQTEPAAAAYLLKPFRHDEIKIHIELAYHHFNGIPKFEIPDDELFLPIDKGYEKIILDDVLYLKADGSYVKVFMRGKRNPYHISTNLSHLAKYFSKKNFYRLSRSVLINLKHLNRLEHGHLYMHTDDTPLQIPVSSRKELIQRLNIVRTK